MARQKGPNLWPGVGAPGALPRNGKPGCKASVERAALVAEMEFLWRADAKRRNVPPRWIDDFAQTAMLYALTAKPRGNPEDFRKHIFWFGSSRAWREHMRLRANESSPTGWILSPTRVALSSSTDGAHESMTKNQKALAARRHAALWARRRDGIEDDETAQENGGAAQAEANDAP